MPTFDMNQVTYDQPFDNELGRFGLSFPVGKVVWIAALDNKVSEVFLITDPDTIDLAKDNDAGTDGDYGKCIFRRGKTYQVSAAIEFILDQAGYTVVP